MKETFQIGSERERAFLVAEMSVFSEDEFTEYCINGCGVSSRSEEQRMECLYCDNKILTESKEHIIQNALGGHLVSTEICCPKCNNSIQKLIDDEFTSIFAPITTRIHNLKKTSNTKGKPSTAAYGLYHGETYEIFIKGNTIVSCPQLSKKLKRNLTSEDINEIEIIGYKFDVENRSFINGICKIATNFAVMNKVPANNLKDKMTIEISDDLLTGIEFKYPVIPFAALNHFDLLMETGMHIETLYHHLILFNIGDLLWCYVDLFNTFQYYILLSDKWGGGHIYTSYCQKIEIIDRTPPIVRVRKPKDILTYSQMYQVSPTTDIDTFKKSIADKIKKKPYECDINDIVKNNVNILSPILDFSDDKEMILEYLTDVSFYQNEDGDLNPRVFRRFSPFKTGEQRRFGSYPDMICALMNDNQNSIRKYTFSKFERLNQYLSFSKYM